MTARLHMHGPKRQEVKIIASPVWRRPVVFSLAHALLANGLLPPPRKGDRGLALRLSTRARRAFGGRMERLLKAAEKRGVLDRRRLDRGEAPSGCLIGWEPTDASAARGEFEVCDDLTLTLAVLERCVGQLYLSSRPPDRSWKHLFGCVLAVDDPRFAGVPLGDELPWRPERPAPTRPAQPAAGTVTFSFRKGPRP